MPPVQRKACLRIVAEVRQFQSVDLCLLGHEPESLSP
jgi:hypothetical protein